MIKLDISVALFLYLFGTVILIFILWIWLEKKPKFSAFKKGQKIVWQCSVCSFMYNTDPEKRDFSRCPQCHSINKREVREL